MRELKHCTLKTVTSRQMGTKTDKLNCLLSLINKNKQHHHICPIPSCLFSPSLFITDANSP